MGQLVKRIQGDFDANQQYSIDGLTTGNYLVKIVETDNEVQPL
jgi:hypothetical protein